MIAEGTGRYQMPPLTLVKPLLFKMARWVYSGWKEYFHMLIQISFGIRSRTFRASSGPFAGCMTYHGSDRGKSMSWAISIRQPFFSFMWV